MPKGVLTKPKTADIPLPPAWIEDDGIPVDPAATYPPIALAEDTVIEEDDEPIRAVTVAGPTSNSVIVGLGALASMSDEEYETKKAVMQRGLARVKDIQQTLMSSGEDYGRVPGIAKPFLQLPGAEKLANFYGYAVRQEVDRLTRSITDTADVPPLAYHVRSYVHLGSLDGPVIAQAFGEANSYEERYRYRFEKRKCPNCGREGLIQGKKDGPLQGKLWCPGREGGCNRKFEPGTIPQAGKVENEDPYGLAETLIQIAAKRSFVAAIRRATGTSGLFTQDSDSPSVQQQVSDDGEAPPPTVESAPPGIQVSVGAKITEATLLQHTELKRLAMERGLNGAKIADILNRLFSMDVEPTGKAASDAVKTLDAEQMGLLLRTLTTGEVPDDVAEADAADAAARANHSVSDAAQAVASGQPLGG